MPHLKTLDQFRTATFALSVALSGIAHAQLGSIIGTPSSGSADAVLHQASNGSPVSWIESTDGNQNRIRQYLAASGQIYAVSWDGPAMANLQALFGTWFNRYQQGAIDAQSSTSSLHSSFVDSNDLVVESSTRLRTFSGRAWLPAALPAGVTSDDIE
jgi:Protein of unknown function (DUF2844)